MRKISFITIASFLGLSSVNVFAKIPSGIIPMTQGSISCHLENGKRFVASPTTDPNIMLYQMMKKGKGKKADPNSWNEEQRWVLDSNKGPVNNNLDLEKVFEEEGQGFVQTKSGPITFFYDEGKGILKRKAVWMNGPGFAKPLKIDFCETSDNKILLNAKMAEAAQLKRQKAEVSSVPGDTDAITGTGEAPASHNSSKQ
jgi:hypothetical protein